MYALLNRDEFDYGTKLIVLRRCIFGHDKNKWFNVYNDSISVISTIFLCRMHSIDLPNLNSLIVEVFHKIESCNGQTEITPTIDLHWLFKPRITIPFSETTTGMEGHMQAIFYSPRFEGARIPAWTVNIEAEDNARVVVPSDFVSMINAVMAHEGIEFDGEHIKDIIYVEPLHFATVYAVFVNQLPYNPTWFLETPNKFTINNFSPDRYPMSLFGNDTPDFCLTHQLGGYVHSSIVLRPSNMVPLQSKAGKEIWFYQVHASVAHEKLEDIVVMGHCHHIRMD